MAEAWSIGGHARARRAGPAAGVDAVLVPREPRRQRVRPPDRGAVHRRRPEHDGGAAGRGHERRAGAAGVRAPTAPTRSARCATTCGRSRSSSRRGRASRSRATRCAGRSGGSGSASRQREGLVLHTISYDDQGRWRPIAAPRLVRRAGHPLRRPEPGPLPHERLRHRRVRHRPDDELARAGLRLPRRDPLPRRRRRTTASGEPDHDPERDLHARGGLRPALEALRLAGRRTRRCAARGASSSRRSSPPRNYEYAFYWYLYQDGTIETEVKLTGIVLDLGRAPRREAGVRPPRQPRALGAEPPALLLRPARHGRRRLTETTCTRCTPRRSRPAPRTPTATPSRRSRPSSRASARRSS